VPLNAPVMTGAPYATPTQLGAPGQPTYGAPLQPLITPPAYGQPQYGQPVAPPARRQMLWWIGGGIAAAVVVCVTVIVIVALLNQPKTPAEKAQATATAQASNGSVVFGPQNGTIKHDPSDTLIETVVATNVTLGDLGIEATFFNPYAATASTPWDYGFIFRSTTGGSQYRLTVESSGDWSLDLVLDKTTGDVNQSVGSGKLSNLATTAQGQNHLALSVKGDTALFFVNDTYIATIDVSGLRGAGSVSIATGMVKGDEVTGKSTGYSNFKVISLR
jgi:hypothetical protein